MKKLASNSVCTLLVFVVFSVHMFFLPAPACARYIDHSDELPGSDFPTALLVVAGIAVAVLVVVLIAKHNNGAGTEKEPGESDEDSSGTGVDSSANITLERYHQLVGGTPSSKAVGPLSRFNLYLDIDQVSENPGGAYEMNAPDLSDLTMKVGFSISF